MIVYQDQVDLPKRSDLSFIISEDEFIQKYGEEQFISYIEKDNEIILKVMCSDGFVLFFRARQ